MNPDPFRTLDRVDPPDRWDDIVDRASLAAQTDPVHHLDDRRRRPPRALVAAAAVFALLAGGAVIARAATDDGGSSQGVAAGPTTGSAVADPAGPVLDGPCPFRFATDSGLPAVTPGPLPDTSHPIEEFPGAAITWGYTTLDTTTVEVGMVPAPHGADTVSGPRGSRSELNAGQITGQHDVALGAMAVVGDGPCPRAWIVVHQPLSPGDEDLLAVDGDGSRLAPYEAAAEALIDRVAAAVVAVEPAPDSADAPDVVTTPETAPASDTTTPDPNGSPDPADVIAPPPGAVIGAVPGGGTFALSVTPGDPLDEVSVSTETDGGQGRTATYLAGQAVAVHLGQGDSPAVVVFGTRPPDTARTAVVGPDGEPYDEGMVFSEDGRYFAVAWPGTAAEILAQFPDGPPPAIHVDADGTAIAWP